MLVIYGTAPGSVVGYDKCDTDTARQHSLLHRDSRNKKTSTKNNQKLCLLGVFSLFSVAIQWVDWAVYPVDF